jgi:hypothetical protein
MIESFMGIPNRKLFNKNAIYATTWLWSSMKNLCSLFLSFWTKHQLSFNGFCVEQIMRSLKELDLSSAVSNNLQAEFGMAPITEES